MDRMKRAEELGRQCQPAEMPSLSHLTLSDYSKVYEPSDDTYLLLDALSLDFPSFPPASTILTTLEIGCGTGVATIYLAKRLQTQQQHRRAIHYVTDINPDALALTLRTATANDIVTNNKLEAIRCDLAFPLLSRLSHSVDVIIFNPPYVPTPKDEVGGCGIAASWAGGERGRVVTDRALPQIATLLKWPCGRAYVVTVDENDPMEIAEVMDREYGVMVEPLVRRRARNEMLTILKMTWKRRPSGV